MGKYEMVLRMGKGKENGKEWIKLSKKVME